MHHQSLATLISSFHARLHPPTHAFTHESINISNKSATTPNQRRTFNRSEIGAEKNNKKHRRITIPILNARMAFSFTSLIVCHSDKNRINKMNKKTDQNVKNKRTYIRYSIVRMKLHHSYTKFYFFFGLESVEQRLNIEPCTISSAFGLFELVSCSFLVISISKSFRSEFNIFRSLQRQSDVEFDVFSLSLSVFISGQKKNTRTYCAERRWTLFGVREKLKLSSGNCCRSGNGARIYCKYVR